MGAAGFVGADLVAAGLVAVGAEPVRALSEDAGLAWSGADTGLPFLPRFTGLVGSASCRGSMGVTVEGSLAFGAEDLMGRGTGGSGTAGLGAAAGGLETTRVGMDAEIGPWGAEGTAAWRPVDVREGFEPETWGCSPVVSGMMRRTRVGGESGLGDGGGAGSSMMRGSTGWRPVIGIIVEDGAIVVASSMMRGTTAWRPVTERTRGTRPDGGWSISSGSVRRVR